MKHFFKNIPGIGPVQIEHVFYEYKDPTLFVLTNGNHQRYLCACCKLGQEWLISQISEEALISLIEDKTTLCKAFNERNNTTFALSWDGQNLTIRPTIESDMYPAPNTRLELSDDRETLEYRTQIKNIITQKER